MSESPRTARRVEEPPRPLAVERGDPVADAAVEVHAAAARRPWSING